MFNVNDILVLFTKNPNKNPEVVEKYKKNHEVVHVMTMGKELYDELNRLGEENPMIIVEMNKNYIVFEVTKVMKDTKILNNLFTLTLRPNKTIKNMFGTDIALVHEENHHMVSTGAIIDYTKSEVELILILGIMDVFNGDGFEIE